MESRVYFEFLDFYRLTEVNDLQFSRPGRFQKLLETLDAGERPWTDEDRSDLFYAYTLFQWAFAAAGGDRLRCTSGDAFLEPV